MTSYKISLLQCFFQDAIETCGRGGGIEPCDSLPKSAGETPAYQIYIVNKWFYIFLCKLKLTYVSSKWAQTSIWKHNIINAADA